MKLYKSLTLAFAMYSKIPMPYIDWDEDSMKWVFCFFPLVGVVIGGVLFLWLKLAVLLSLGSSLTALGALLIPLMISGGIHLDGLCDTCDALGSHQSRERKLEILKDSHIGAFGVMGCVLYLIALYALWSSISCQTKEIFVLSLLPILSRSWSSLMAVSCKNARGSGMLFSFTGDHTNRNNQIFDVIWLILVGIVMLLTGGAYGGSVIASTVICTVYYLYMSRKEFGGITGDLEGWYLQMLELMGLCAVVIAEKVVFF